MVVIVYNLCANYSDVVLYPNSASSYLLYGAMYVT